MTPPHAKIQLHDPSGAPQKIEWPPPPFFYPCPLQIINVRSLKEEDKEGFLVKEEEKSLVVKEEEKEKTFMVKEEEEENMIFKGEEEEAVLDSGESFAVWPWREVMTDATVEILKMCLLKYFKYFN